MQKTENYSNDSDSARSTVFSRRDGIAVGFPLNPLCARPRAGARRGAELAQFCPCFQEAHSRGRDAHVNNEHKSTPN